MPTSQNSTDELLDYAAETTEPEPWEKSLADFIDIWTDLFIRRHQMSKEKAGRIAREMAAETAHYRGGRSFYLPKDDRIKRAMRDSAIYTEFDGTNTEDIAEKYRITRTAVYIILERQRTMTRNRRANNNRET